MAVSFYASRLQIYYNGRRDLVSLPGRRHKKRKKTSLAKENTRLGETSVERRDESVETKKRNESEMMINGRADEYENGGQHEPGDGGQRL